MALKFSAYKEWPGKPWYFKLWKRIKHTFVKPKFSREALEPAQPVKRVTRVTIFKGDVDISDDVTLENRKSNPFGWSQMEVHYQGERIGWIENGYCQTFSDGYSFKETIE